jgi:hypothetical protein
LDHDFWIFLFIGFLAQVVEGSMGMAYGLICTTALLAAGIAPATASASVHVAKILTSGASASSHFRHGNVDKPLLWVLVLTGCIGGAAGAFLITGLDPATVKPFVVIYLGLMGLLILWRAFKGVGSRPMHWFKGLPLGLVGGFLDGVGGGGWGPTVTSTLVGAGREPRKAVGTSNVAQFFVAVVISGAFLASYLTGHWKTAVGLADQNWSVVGVIVGGLIAAPMAGRLAKVLPPRILTWAVGLLVVGLAIWQTLTLYKLI